MGFHGRAASSINVKDAERYLEWVKTKVVVPQTSKPLSADQRHRRLEEILACWTWAVKERMLIDNPWVDMPKRISVPPQSKLKLFSREEIELIIDGFQHDPHYKSYSGSQASQVV
jgi:site-specific recombinase XerD